MPTPRLLPVHRRRLPDGAAGFGANLAGTAFLQDIPAIFAAFPNAKLIIEVAWGASISADPTTWSWTDISADVLQDGNRKVNIAPMGRSASSTQTQPAGCSYLINNTSGAYSQGPQSSNYPNVKLNVPMRVSVNLTGYPNDSQVRFQGYIWSMKPSWDTTGNYAVVEVKASGIIRRLSTGTQPVRSALNRSVRGIAPNDYTPFQYWPLEDGAGATQAASAVTGGTPMSVSGSGTVTWAAQTDLTGSQPLPTIGASASLFAVIPAYSSTTQWVCQFVHKLSSAPTDVIIAEITLSGSIYSRYVVRATNADGGTIQLETYLASDGSLADILGFINLSTWNIWRMITVYTRTDGSILTFGFNLATPTSQPGPNEGITITALFGTVTGIRLLGAAGSSFGHVALFTDASFNTATDTVKNAAAMDGYSGESPVARLIRLCFEENIRIDVIGTSTATMGPQGADTLMNLLRECEAADLGILGDGRGPGLYYISRSARYNQIVGLSLTATVDHLMPPFEAEGDDLVVFNRFVVSRKGGSTGEFEDENGSLGTRSIGTFESSASINVNTDTVLVDVAAWLVHVNTVLGYRYPTVTLDMRKIPSKVLDWLRINPSSRLQVANVANWATQHPNETIDLLVEGWSESLSRFFWDVQTNCSPESPYEVGALDSLLRIETGGSTIATEANASATSLSIASSGVVWVDKITFPADFNFDIEAGTGERMTVTDIVGTSSPQTFTVTRSVNGIAKTLPVGTTIKLWRPTALAL